MKGNSPIFFLLEPENILSSSRSLFSLGEKLKLEAKQTKKHWYNGSEIIEIFQCA